MADMERQRELAQSIVALNGSLEVRETGKPTRAVWDYAFELAELVLKNGKTEAERIDPNEHISADDPRYDGFRIRDLWVATATAPDNQEAMLYVDDLDVVGLAPGPTFASDERRLVRIRKFAQLTATRCDCEIRIRHFIPQGEDEVLTP